MKRKTIVALVLGILSLVLWLLPLFGLPISIVGLVLSIIGLKDNKKIAMIALICSGIGLILSLISATIVMYQILLINFNPGL